MLSRRDLIKTSLTCGIAVGFFPTKVIASTDKLPALAKLTLGFPAGTSSDAIARRYAHKLQGAYAGNVIVENRPGAGGRIAMEQFKRATPDGLSMMLIPSALLTLYPHTYQSLRYDPKADFTLVATVYQSSLGIAVGPSVPADIKSVEQLAAWAKAQKEPLFFSGNAQGATPHFMGLQFSNATGIPMEFVPYQGGTPAMNALVAGELPMVCMSMGNLIPLAKAGKIRILASFDAERNPLYPEIPTLKELGYPDLVENESGVIAVPAKTPGEVVERLEKNIAIAMEAPDLKAGMRSHFLNANFVGSADTTAAHAAMFERHRKVVATSQFTPME